MPTHKPKGTMDGREADLRALPEQASIDVRWRDESKVPPPPSFVAQANMSDKEVFRRFSEENFPECFREYAEMLTWDQPWHTTLDTTNAPFWKWFIGGKLNASKNCVDRHLPRSRDKAAIIFVPEPESEGASVVTYQDLHVRVNEFAALLRDFAALRKGDRITFHLPMVPDLPVSMLAAARLGVVHSQVFGGFSGQACGKRIADSGSHVLVTMDGYYRNGHLIDHKANADVAVKHAGELGQKVDKVLIWRRYPGKNSSQAPIVEGRDFFVDDMLKKYSGELVEPVSVPAEDPLFLMYTSGTTGKPKGCQHSTGGYLSYVTGTSKYLFDIHPEDVYWCLADIGWITGHSYIVYGPLALAATTVIYEGVPGYPDPGRPWRIAERLGVTIFHTSPTSVRQLRKAAPEEPKKHNYHFKSMTTVGEPIEPEVWKWYFDVVGKGQAAITDTWWLTETGGVLCSTLPAIHPMKPGSAGPALPGIYPVILDEDGKELEKGSRKAGNMCIRNPWPGIMQTIWGDPDRFVAQYYSKYRRDPKSHDWRDWPFLTGDGATQDLDGYFRILGRIDDVIKVAGHRLGAKEIESACLTLPEVAEAAAVPLLDVDKGRVPDVYVSLKPGYAPSRDLEERVHKVVEDVIGKIARPKNVYVVADMPKTRSGKIMRRVMAAVSNGVDYGDTSTLVNPEVVDQLRAQVEGRSGRVEARLSKETIFDEVKGED